MMMMSDEMKLELGQSARAVYRHTWFEMYDNID